ncbi:MAG: short-chain dehydrogenase [Pseudonocardiales bacterium]|nr:short-chain dehydrogenase [Pseudonocardiales bacterium]
MAMTTKTRVVVLRGTSGIGLATAKAAAGPEQGRAFLVRVVRAPEAVRLAVPHLRVVGSATLTSGTAAYRGGAGWFLGSAGAAEQTT